jgi:hypothetical protein
MFWAMPDGPRLAVLRDRSRLRVFALSGAIAIASGCDQGTAAERTKSEHSPTYAIDTRSHILDADDVYQAAALKVIKRDGIAILGEWDSPAQADVVRANIAKERQRVAKMKDPQWRKALNDWLDFAEERADQAGYAQDKDRAVADLLERNPPQ